MKKWLVRITLGVSAAMLLTVGIGYLVLRSMGLYRAPHYDTHPPALPALSRPAILVLYKTSGYIHTEAIPAANALFTELARQRGYSIYITDNGAIINPKDLDKFDVVIWNNNTGSILSEVQQQSFRHWLESGGKWLGLHSASDNHFSWPWYVDEVIGAHFNGATRIPSQPRAKLVFELSGHPVLAGMPKSLWLNDEFYSFSNSPRATVDVLASIDESTYIDGQGWMANKLRMGDHPMIWSRKVANGTVVYSAIGHRAETYAIPEYRMLLGNILAWLIAGAPADNAP